MNRDKLITSAQSYALKGQYKKAALEYERLLREEPEDLRVRLKLADLYVRDKRPKRAVEAYVDVARVYEDGGFTNKAVAVYKQVVGLAPDRVDLRVALASSYESLGLANDAVEQYCAAAEVLGRQGDHLPQLDVIHRALGLDPSNVSGRVRLAEAYSAQGRSDDAASVLRAASDRLWRDEAIHDFQRVAERLLYHHPDDAPTARRLASVYVDAGQPQRALPKLKMAYLAAPRDLELLETIVRAFEQLGQLHKATAVLKEMARIYERSGLEREREGCMRRVLRLVPDDEDARGLLGMPGDDAAETLIEFDDEGGDIPSIPAEPAPSVMDEDLAAALIADALEGEVPGVEPSGSDAPPAAAQVDSGDEDGIEALFTEVWVELRDTTADPVDDIEFEVEEEFGFEDEEDEQTVFDENFIPEEVRAQAAAATEPPESADAVLTDGLIELDFYIRNGLRAEAEALLGDLRQRFDDHPDVAARAARIG